MELLSNLSYVNHAKPRNSLENDAIALLNANNKLETVTHSINVSKTCIKLAKQFNLDEKVAQYSGILHDISAFIRPVDMLDYAERSGWYIDESERKYNFILHQRISEIIAREYFGVTYERILSAIACHSTLKASASDYDMILFLADKISWDQQGVPPFLDVLEKALETSLKHASLEYINYVIDNNMILLPHRWLVEAKAWLEK